MFKQAVSTKPFFSYLIYILLHQKYTMEKTMKRKYKSTPKTKTGKTSSRKIILILNQTQTKIFSLNKNDKHFPCEFPLKYLDLSIHLLHLSDDQISVKIYVLWNKTERPSSKNENIYLAKPEITTIFGLCHRNYFFADVDEDICHILVKMRDHSKQVIF